MFRPKLWPKDNDYYGNPFKKGVPKAQDVREVWFTGFHSDIGGGHPETKSALAKLPLKWMIEQTEPTGLSYSSQTVNEIVLGTDPKKRYVAPDSNAPANNSMNWGWAILEFIPRHRPKDSQRPSFLGISIPFFERRTIPSGASIHRSVIERAEASGKKPANLPSDYRVED